MSAEEDVARGAQLLDEQCPNWARRIDRENLRMAGTRTCVLGQLYGSVFEGRAALDLDGLGAMSFGISHWGFNPPIDGCFGRDPWTQLCALWLAQVDERLR